MNFRRVIIIDLASLGIGEASDANRFNSVGADTLGHVASHEGINLKLPTLSKLGLGNIRFGDPILGITPVDKPIGYFGKIHEKNTATDCQSGLREMLDYQDPIRVTSVLDPIVKYSDNYARSIIITNYQSYFSNQNLSDIIAVNKDKLAYQSLHHEAVAPIDGLIYTKILGLQKAAVTGDFGAYVQSLREADQQIARLINEMYKTDLLLITASFADDLTISTTPTREYLPLLAYVPADPEGSSLGIRHTLADIGSTIADVFQLDVAKESIGHSFLSELNN